MKKVFIINGHEVYPPYSMGKLTGACVDAGKEVFKSKGFEIKETSVEDAYDIEEEVQKFLWADLIMFHLPGFWMSEPGKLKVYIDKVYTSEEAQGTIFDGDGRHRIEVNGELVPDPTKKYGTGGLLKSEYMVCTTWNAPKESFDDPKQFFEGKDIDELLFHFHKAQEFVGLKALPTYTIYNVYKSNDDIAKDIRDFKVHLTSNI